MKDIMSFMLSNSRAILLFLISTLFVLPLPILPLHRLLAVSICLFCYFIIYFGKTKNSISVKIGILVSLIICYNLSLLLSSSHDVILYDWVVIVLLLLVSFVLVQELSSKLDLLLKSCFWIFILIAGLKLISTVLSIRVYGFAIGNHNSLAYTLLILFPYQFYGHEKKVFTLLAYIFIISFCLYFGVRGVLLIVAVSSIYFFIELKVKAVRIFNSGLLALLVIAIVVNRDWISDQYTSGYYWRLHKMKISINSFLDNPLLGIGSGNWQSFACNYGTQVTTTDHCLLTLFLSENGIFGLVLILLSVYFLVKGRGTEKSRGMYLSCLFYFLGSFFYYTAHSDILSYSTNEALGVLSLVGLCGNGKLNINFNYDKMLIRITSVFLLVYFLVFNFLYYSKIDSVHSLDRSSLLSRVFRINSVRQNEAANGYRTINYELAMRYSDIQEREKANVHFIRALDQTPCNVNVKRSYAIFLLSGNKSDWILANNFLNKSDNNNMTLVDYVISLESHIRNNNSEEAKMIFRKFERRIKRKYPNMHAAFLLYDDGNIATDSLNVLFDRFHEERVQSNLE